MSEQEEKGTIDTSCANCIFAKRSTSGQQTGCKLGRLEKFADKGTKLDFDGKSYIIKDRICLMLCSPKHIETYKMKNPEKDMRKAIALKCAVYIVADEEHTFEDVKTTIESLLNQRHKAHVIYIVVQKDFYKRNPTARQQLVRYMNSCQREDKDLVWQISNILEDGASREWALDHVIAKCNTPFYAVFIAGFKVPTDYLSNIDKALNDDLERFSVLMPIDDYWNGAFVQTILHKSAYFKGNMPQILEEYEDGGLAATSIMDKVEFYANKEEKPHMVRKVQEICPSIQA